MTTYIEIFINLLDIAIATVVVYHVLKFFVKSEKMIFVINAIILILILYLFAQTFNLSILNSILTNVFSWGVVLIFILFQTEIRESLESLGSTEYDNKSDYKVEDFVENFVNTLEILSNDKVGALITFEMDMPLTEYTKKAIFLDAKYSPHLLQTIFNKESPLHDGAVVIKGAKIMYASTYYPISLDLNIDKKYGTRHRSGITISSKTDSLSVIVSEETGDISLAYKGNLYAKLEK